MSKSRFFISFIEEAVLNPDYKGFIGGRIEVYRLGEAYASEEIRFFTKKQDEFYKFREDWDFKDVTEAELNEIRETVKEEYMERPEK